MIMIAFSCNTVLYYIILCTLHFKLYMDFFYVDVFMIFLWYFLFFIVLVDVFIYIYIYIYIYIIVLNFVSFFKCDL